MKKNGILFLLLVVTICCKAQGGWDIAYIHIDSLDMKIIGKDIKLDFKSDHTINEKPHRNLMTLIGIEDTITISLNNKEVKLIEIREIYADWGFYDE